MKYNKIKGNTSDSLNDLSTPGSDLEFVEKRVDGHELGLELTVKLDRFLAQQVFNELNNSDKEQSEEDESLENVEKLGLNRKKCKKSENDDENDPENVG